MIEPVIVPCEGDVVKYKRTGVLGTVLGQSSHRNIAVRWHDERLGISMETVDGLENHEILPRIPFYIQLRDHLVNKDFLYQYRAIHQEGRYKIGKFNYIRGKGAVQGSWYQYQWDGHYGTLSVPYWARNSNLDLGKLAVEYMVKTCGDDKPTLHEWEDAWNFAFDVEESKGKTVTRARMRFS